MRYHLLLSVINRPPALPQLRRLCPVSAIFSSTPLLEICTGNITEHTPTKLVLLFKSFADFLGIGSSYASANAEGSGGGTAGDGGDCITPLSTSRSSRSSQNDHRDRGFSSHSAGAGAVASTAGVGVPTTPASGSTAGGGGGGGGGSSSARKWESTGKRRSSSGGSGGAAGARNGGEGRRAVVRQSSGFVRDFIRGAGIHRLDPRRLAGMGTFFFFFPSFSCV